MKRCSGLTTATIPYSVKSIAKRAKGEDFRSSSFAFPEYHPLVHDEIEDAGEDEGNEVAKDDIEPGKMADENKGDHLDEEGCNA